MIAAAKDSHIAALVLMGTPGHPGADVVLAQQKHALDRSSLSDADKQARVDLQKRIHEAVITGKGWERCRRSSAVRSTLRNSRAS